MKLLQEIVYYLTIRPRLNALKRLLPDTEIYPFGSRYVCNPPVLGTDIDFFIYSKKSINYDLIKAGFHWTDKVDYPDMNADKFTAWRKGKVNVIASPYRVFIDDTLFATYLCRHKNVIKKYHRVLVYSIIRGEKALSVLFPGDFDPDLKRLLFNFTGPHGPVLRKAFLASIGVLSHGGR